MLMLYAKALNLFRSVLTLIAKNLKILSLSLNVKLRSAVISLNVLALARKLALARMVIVAKSSKL